MKKQKKTTETQLNFTEKNLKKIDKLIAKMTDEDILTTFAMLINTRLSLSYQFVQTEDGLVTHQQLVAVSGNKMIESAPQELEWPMQYLPLPEAFKGKLN